MQAKVCEGSPGGWSETTGVGFVNQVGLSREWNCERDMELWMSRVVKQKGRSDRWSSGWVRTGVTGTRMRLTKRWSELIQETWWSIPKGAISYFLRGWCRWPSKSNDGWRASTTRTLNRDEVMKVLRLGNCENFVGKREELVFDAFIDSELVETA